MKRKNLWKHALVGGLLLCLSASAVFAAEEQGGASDENEAAQAAAKQIADADNALGNQLTAKLLEQESNVFISPYSVSAVLSMLSHCSAEGEQTEALNGFLGYGELTEDAVLSGQKLLLESLTDNPADGQLTPDEAALYGIPTVEIANALYLDESLPLLSAFDELNPMLDAYQAELAVKSLSSQETTDEINEWVAEKTHDMIDRILDQPLEPDAAMLLMNAVYFKGAWLNTFYDSLTDKQTFYGTENETEIDMMHQLASFPYRETENYQILCLPYSASSYLMYLYLPKEPDGWKSWKDADSLEALTDIDPDSLQTTRIDLSMPRFELECEADLKEILSALGLDCLFTENIYDRITAQPILLSEILHKTALKIDENGTEASAVTAAIAYATGAMQETDPVEMNIDRPFFFTVTNRDTGVNLFEGCILNIN